MTSHDFRAPAHRTRRAGLILGLLASVSLMLAVLPGTSAQAVIPRPSWHEMPLATPGGSPSALAPDAAGGVWYVDNVNREIVHAIYSAGVTKTYAMGSLGYIQAQTVGADGMLYLSDPLNRSVAVLDPATGALSDIPLETPTSEAHSLVAAADGVWFTDPRPGLLGKIGYDGVLHTVAVPGSWVGDRVAVDDTGLVWARDPLSTALFVYDPVTDAFSTVDPAVDGVEGIAPASRGGVWVAGAKEVVRVTTGGTAERSAIQVDPGASAWIRTMHEGLDNTLYFADFTGGLGWRDPSGAVEFLTPPMAGAHPAEVTVTSDGLVWYLDVARGTVGWKL